MHLEYKVTISENGRINIPAKIRDQLHLSSGDQLMLTLDKELTLIPIKNKIKEFQALVKSRNKDNISLVDSLIESRRKEFNNE
ncbi:AbrB/MazE/SpoVT family DNA-binding domain-containing protein [Rickettsia helvetica]|nr:AbrB/MazE/SpoVT family DNA-binding domain-containing protein [Rickettsia helvetica]MCZ6884056.1 AbrB/MazE/SpoVT family DNA-binding domain-containing protein [Rickettsia endosymbiont of Ixodes ricinus]MCZ6896112.1 AbrB/MazE/SpoVT family DNA-binding domain-containing protein [Rickettsia endosymbiont of Ixodes ricinus]